MVGHALNEAGQHFLSRWLRLRLHVDGRHKLVRLVGKDGKRDTAVAFVLGNLPNAPQHQRLAVLAAEVIRLLASFIAPFIEPLAGNDAAPFLEMFAELPLAHAVGADIKQRWPGFIAGTQPVNAGPREDDALPCDKDRDKLRRRDIRIKLEIKTRPAVILARDIGPFPDRAEAIAHGRKMGASLGESSALAKMPFVLLPPAREIASPVSGNTRKIFPKMAGKLCATVVSIRAHVYHHPQSSSVPRFTAGGRPCPIGWIKCQKFSVITVTRAVHQARASTVRRAKRAGGEWRPAQCARASRGR